MKRSGAGAEDRLALDAVRVRHAAFFGAHRLAGIKCVESYALGAAIRIDDVDALAFADGVVRAFAHTRAAIDALSGDPDRHAITPSRVSRRVRCEGGPDTEPRSAGITGTRARRARRWRARDRWRTGACPSGPHLAGEAPPRAP